MARIKRVATQAGAPIGWSHWCPGCASRHVIRVEQAEHNGARWTFDGNEAQPTFSPSINARWGHYATGVNEWDCGECRRAREHHEETPCGVCHYFVHGGAIQFCGDSTHKLAGQTVDLPELPA